jgi:hypothetical protein
MEEVEEFTTFLADFSGQPISISRQFNLPILNVLWRITVGQRFAYTDPQLLDIMGRMVEFYSKWVVQSPCFPSPIPGSLREDFQSALFSLKNFHYHIFLSNGSSKRKTTCT